MDITQSIIDQAPEGWHPMSEHPTRPAVVEVLGPLMDPNDTYLSAWEDGIYYGCGAKSCDFESLRKYGVPGYAPKHGRGWRYFQNAAPTTPAQPAAPLQTEREPDLICASDRTEPDDIDAALSRYERDSDRAGIAAFVPPPEPQKVERPVRVSTVERGWRWMVR